MSKSVTSTLALHGESTGPDWSRARMLQDGMILAFRYAFAGEILLGHELLTLKMELGFCGAGRPSKLPHDAGIVSLNRTWPNWCKSELGISDDKADRRIQSYEAAKLRLKKLGGETQLLTLLETPASKLDAQQKELLSQAVDRIDWGDSKKQLLEDYHLVKRQAATEGGENPCAKKKPEAEVIQQLAFAFFAPPFEKLADSVRKLGSLRIKQDYSAYLHQLEIASEDPKALTLTSLRDTLTAALTGDLRTTLAEVEAAIAAKSKPFLP